VSVLLGDSPDAADGRVSVAFNSWGIAGGGNRFPILRRILRRSAARLRDTELQTHDIVRDFMTTSDDWRAAPVAWLQFDGEIAGADRR